MGKQPKERSSELVTAAEVLDEELRRFQRVSEALAKLSFTSKKNLERGAELLTELSEVDDRLRGHVAALVSAITTLRDRQQAQAAAVQARAMELEQRTGVFQQLLTQYASLGEDAARVNVAMQEVAGLARTSPPPPELAPALDQAMAQIAGLSDMVQALADQAREKEFEDVARQADSLRQQLLSGKNKLGLLKRNLGLT